MKLTIISILFLLISITNGNYAQEIVKKDISKLERGQEIINLARKAIDKGNGLDKLKTFYINIDHTTPGQWEFTTEISIILPGKVKDVTTFGATKSYEVFEEGKYSEDSEMFLNGKAYSAARGGRPLIKPKIPPYFKEIFSKEKIQYLENNPDKLRILSMEAAMWSDIFPILLFNPINTDVEYEYVGKAESAKQRADIIDVKSDFYRKIRLFFDEKTHLLLMMTQELDKPESKYIEKRYFSGYETVDGLLIAKRIGVDAEEIYKDGREKKVYKPSPRTYKEIKINPKVNIETLFTYPVKD